MHLYTPCAESRCARLQVCMHPSWGTAGLEERNMCLGRVQGCRAKGAKRKGPSRDWALVSSKFPQLL